jgi:prevent-host-death family protein
MAPAPARPQSRRIIDDADLRLAEPQLPTIGVRELSRRLSSVIADVNASGIPVIVTRHGVPIAAVVPIPGPDDGPGVKAP